MKSFRCPECDKKLATYCEDAASHGVFSYCKRCKREIEIQLPKGEKFMGAITINGHDLELDLIDVSIAKKVEDAQKTYLKKVGAAEGETSPATIMQTIINAAAECMDSIFGDGTSHTLFGGSTNTRLYMDAMKAIKDSYAQQILELKSAYPMDGEG